jgi:hypothetical protein
MREPWPLATQWASTACNRDIFTFCLNQFCRSLITTWRFITFQLCNSNFNFKRLGSDTNGLAVRISMWLTSLTLCTFSKRVVVLPHIQNIEGIRKQITSLIFHEVASRSVTPLKLIYSSIEVSNVFVLIVRCDLINFVFQIFPFFISEMPADLSSHIVQIIPIYFA